MPHNKRFYGRIVIWTEVDRRSKELLLTTKLMIEIQSFQFLTGNQIMYDWFFLMSGLPTLVHMKNIYDQAHLQASYLKYVFTSQVIHFH